MLQAIRGKLAIGTFLFFAKERRCVFDDGERFLSDESSEESFITEHYWGYARQRDSSTLEYRVEDPRANVWHASKACLEGELASLYGVELAGCLKGEPSSVFVIDGSKVNVREGLGIDSHLLEWRTWAIQAGGAIFNTR